MSRSAKPLVEGFVGSFSWSISVVSHTTPLRIAAAVIVLYFGAIVTLYALWLGLLLWFVTGKHGMARSVGRRESVERAALAVFIAALAVPLLTQGYSVGHTAGICVLATAGAVLWLNRRVAIRLGRERVARQHSS
jgi:hypothetical protein